MKHEIAIYHDASGKEHTIKAKDLVKDDVFETAKVNELWDRDEQIRLEAREGVYGDDDDVVRERHFYASPTGGLRNVYDTVEDNPVHNARVGEIERILDEGKIQKVITGSYVNKVFEPVELFEVMDYQWESEVTRIIDEHAIVRHDIFGQSNNIRMSILRPWVAIEVINEHYPEERAFEAFILWSRMIPFLVAFDFTDRPDHFLKIDTFLGMMAVKLYIYGGIVWYEGKEESQITTSAALKIFAENELRRLEKKDAWKEKMIQEKNAKGKS